MHIVQIEHPVPDYDGWKRAFDSDPVKRKQSGVKRFKILRPIDDPKYVIIELELDSSKEAESFLTAIRNLWKDAEGKVMFNPKARIIEIVEDKEL
jgi:ribosomal protein L35AE/L33A